jgi:capsule polysaccharide export protein KpsE/RkpR
MLPVAIMVVLPTLIGAIYFFLIAADRYEAEAKFVVRSPSSTATSQLASLMQGSTITRSSLRNPAKRRPTRRNRAAPCLALAS